MARSEGPERGGAGRLRRLLPLGALAAAAAAAYGAGLHEWVSLDALARHRAELETAVAANLPLAALGYVALYAAVVAASLPGGAALTIAGGFLFGALLGGALAVVGATIGATGVFLVARTAAGDMLRARAGGAVAKIAEGFRRDAFSYLLFLRLVPAFPFVAVNLAPALVGVRLRTYVAATAIGIVPATFVFASVGAGLGSALAEGREISVGAVLTPETLLALGGLALLALAPIAARRLRRGRPP